LPSQNGREAKLFKAFLAENPDESKKRDRVSILWKLMRHAFLVVSEARRVPIWLGRDFPNPAGKFTSRKPGGSPGTPPSGGRLANHFEPASCRLKAAFQFRGANRGNAQWLD
jgi:hypothetical protein